MNCLTRDHPRLRGEYLFPPRIADCWMGSPPLARGILFSLKCTEPEKGITPACAGNTFRTLRRRSECEDHPRLRGEYNHIIQIIEIISGSPPLARGILPGSPCGPVCPGITPACAGNTRCISEICGTGRDHPRLRGEYTKRIPYLQHFSTLCR